MKKKKLPRKQVNIDMGFELWVKLQTLALQKSIKEQQSVSVQDLIREAVIKTFIIDLGGQ